MTLPSYIESVTITNDNPRKRSYRKRSSYKDKLTERHTQYSNTINTVEGPLKKKVDEYYAALSGQYLYTDTHTGKQVHARTYKKRMEFAHQKIEEIEAELNLGYVDSFQAESLKRFVRDAYNTAIRDNEYLKEKNTRDLAVATRLRQGLNSLENKVASIDTTPKETISSPYRCETQSNDASAKRKTPSNLLNRLNARDEQKQNTVNEAKLPKNAPIVWSTPPKRKRFDFDIYDVERLFKIGVVGALLGVIGVYGTKVYNKFYKENPQSPTPITQTLPEMPETYKPSPFVTGESLPQFVSPTPVTTNVEEPKPISNVTPSNYQAPVNEIKKESAAQPKYSFLENAKRLQPLMPAQQPVYRPSQQESAQKERIRQLNEEARQLAIMRAKAAQGKLHPVFSAEAQKRIVQQQEMEKERAEKENKRVPITLSGREALSKIYEERTHKRKLAENLRVVKQVVYSLGKDPVTTFPNQSYRESLASADEE